MSKSIQIDDSKDGVVIPAHQHLMASHSADGQITWSTKSGTGTWYVTFNKNGSPCSNGSEFGNEPGIVNHACVISACSKTGDPSCRSYSYSTGLSKNQPLHDPDIIIDP